MSFLPARIRPWCLVAIGVALCGGAAAWLYLTRSASPRTPAEMIASLPQAGATVAYIDIDAVRKAGLLQLLGSSKTVQEADYKSFVDSTGFDYERDLEAVAASFTNSGTFFVVRGKFDWPRLQSYTKKHNGVCRDEFCRAPGSEQQRWISFWPIRSGLMALASSPSESAARDITPRRLAADAAGQSPDRPVWISVPPSALADMKALPAGAQSFASPLVTAERVVFSAGTAGGQLRLYLDVTSPSEVSAEELQKRLQNATDLLKRMLEREHRQPNEADMSGLLAGGAFRREGRRVYGEWPLYKKLIESIVGGRLS
jgi:hypothetical protein